MSQPRRPHRAGIRLLVVIAGIVAALLLAEGLCRLRSSGGGPLAEDLAALQLAPGPSPTLPWLGLPGCAACRPALDSLGFPGPEPVGPSSEPTRLTVALLGDERCQGPSLDYAATLPARLESLLTGHPDPRVVVAVRSYCLPGSSLREQREILERFVLPRAPDLLLHLVSGDDAVRRLTLAPHPPRDTTGPTSVAPLAGRVAPFSWIPDGARAWLARKSFLYQRVGIWLALLLDDPDDGDPAAAGQLASATLEQLADEEVLACQRTRTQLGVVLLPRADHSRCRPGPEPPPPGCADDDERLDRLRQLYSEREVPVLDLRPALMARADLELGLGAAAPDDPDLLGPAGHAFVARRVAPLARKLLAPKRIDLPPFQAVPAGTTPP